LITSDSLKGTNQIGDVEDVLELPELVRMDGAMEAVGLGRGGERARPAAGDAPRRPRAGRQGQGRGFGGATPPRRPGSVAGAQPRLPRRAGRGGWGRRDAASGLP